MQKNINTAVLMSGAEYFSDASPINAYMDSSVPVDRERAQHEHSLIRSFLEEAGVKVTQVEPPKDCQDGVYTANWALVRGDVAILSRLPNARKHEEAYAESILRNLGKTVLKLPENSRFSGQGDMLACGDYLFAGSGYRTDKSTHSFVERELGYKVISLQTVPQRRFGLPVTNKASGWPDSFFYDIDLALAVIQGPTDKAAGTIAWCPKAFTVKSQAIIRSLTEFDKIEVSLKEAKEAFACNLVSTGDTVIMSAEAPKLASAIEARGLCVMKPNIQELRKGGGYIRCTTLTLNAT